MSSMLLSCCKIGQMGLLPRKASALAEVAFRPQRGTLGIVSDTPALTSGAKPQTLWSHSMSCLQVMMCSASSRPTISSASKIIMQQGAGIKPFFAGVGPRALSNGLNSAVFFCFFEALRGVSPPPKATKVSSTAEAPDNRSCRLLCLEKGAAANSSGALEMPGKQECRSL